MGQDIRSLLAPRRTGLVGAKHFQKLRRDFIDRRGEGELPDELAVRAKQDHACRVVDRVIVGSGLAHLGVADPEVVGGAALQCG